MPYKSLEKRREYRRGWYTSHRKSEMAHVKRRKLEIRKWLEEYKKNLKCSICGESHPATIDFHHKDESEKEQGIAYFVGFGYSIDRIKKEMEKCEVLCANCHRKIHYKNNKL